MILIVFLITLLIVIIILKVKAKFRHFIGDADAFQRLALYTSCLQNKMQIKSSFYVLVFGGVLARECSENPFPMSDAAFSPCFCVDGEHKGPLPCSLSGTGHTAGNTEDLQPLCATPSPSLTHTTETLHISSVFWDILMCMVFSRGEMKVGDQ